MSEDTVKLFSDPAFDFSFPDDLNKLWDPETGEYLVVSGPSDEDPGYQGVPIPVLRVAVVDSGVLSGHPTIHRRLEASVDLVGGGPEDQFGHGTIVALSIFGGIPESRIRLLSVKVVDRSGLGKEGDIVRGIDWAIEQKVDVVNLSLGVERTRCRGHCKLCKAAKRAIDQGILVFAAGGNTAGAVACPARLATRGQPGMFARFVVEDQATTQVISEGKVLSTESYRTVLTPVVETTAEFRAAGDLLHADRLDEALKAFTPLIDSQQPYERTCAAFNVGIIRDRLGDPEGAQAAYLQAIDLANRWTKSYVAKSAYNLGELRERLGDTAGAEQAYRIGAESPPDEEWNLQATFKLARLLFLRRSFAEAERMAQGVAVSRRIDLAPKATVLLGLIAEDTGRRDVAEAHYRTALTMGDPDAAAIAQENLSLLESS
jgi:Subtilase family/Tetratricopeptide repeat